MSEKWFYKVGEQEIGPLTAQQLKQLAEEKRLAPTDPIRRENDTAWHLASQVKGLFAAQPAKATGIKRGEAAEKPAEAPKPAEAAPAPKPAEAALKPAPVIPDKGTKKIRVARAIPDSPSDAPAEEAPVKVAEPATRPIPRGIPVGAVPPQSPPSIEVPPSADFAAFTFDTSPPELGKRQPGGKSRAGAAGDDAAVDPAALKKQKQQQQFYIMAGAAGGLAVLGIILIFVLSRGPAEKPQVADADSAVEVVEGEPAAKTTEEENKSGLRSMADISQSYAIPGVKNPGVEEPVEDPPANETGESAPVAVSVKPAENLEAAAKKAKYSDATRASKTVGDYSYKITDIRYDTKDGPYLKATLEIRHKTAFQQPQAMKNWDTHLRKVTCKIGMEPTAKSLMLERDLHSTAIAGEYKKDITGIRFPLEFRAPDGLPKIVFVTIPDFVHKGKEYNFFIPQRAWGVADEVEEPETKKPASADGEEEESPLEGPDAEPAEDDAEDEPEALINLSPRDAYRLKLEEKYAVDDQGISVAEREGRENSVSIELMAAEDRGFPLSDFDDESPAPEAPADEAAEGGLLDVPTDKAAGKKTGKTPPPSAKKPEKEEEVSDFSFNFDEE